MATHSTEKALTNSADPDQTGQKHQQNKNIHL